MRLGEILALIMSGLMVVLMVLYTIAYQTEKRERNKK